VSLPAELLEQVDLERGGKVFVALNPDIPGTLLVIPERLMAEIFPDVLSTLRDHQRGRGKRR
jgi:hypothetical protein